MGLFDTPEEHAANPPETWEARKAGERNWSLTTAAGDVLQSGLKSRRAALAYREEGFYVSLYRKTSRWFAGEPVAGWRPYADVLAEEERRRARQAARGLTA